ncbi:MAG: DNA-3-methyladenine glycosylase [Firmicutes bacterium]|nr:DNA-3-methyladenine glycosylase [Bacillota bacterium]
MREPWHSDRQEGTYRLVPPSFYNRPALELAPCLLGSLLVHETTEGITAGIVVETEAYAGPEDRAAHSFADRRSERTAIMYDTPGKAYIFAIYGMYWCCNVVAGPGRKPEAVLIRALQPTEGIDLMRARRSHRAQLHSIATKPPEESASSPLAKTRTLSDQQLTSGPGRLCQAMGIDQQCYGLAFFDPASPLHLYAPQESLSSAAIATGPRIGIAYAGAWATKPWRFWIKGNPYVSASKAPASKLGHLSP